MGLYSTTAYTTTGTKEGKNLDPSIAPFGVTVAVTLVTGPASYKLQYSLSPMDVADADALWFDSINMPAGTAASAVTNFFVPVARVRLVIATLTAGSLTMQVRQGYTNN